MTAAGSSGVVNTVCTPDSCHSPPPPDCLTQPRIFCCRRRRGADHRVKLRFRSAPGVWLLLGVIVVMLGMSVAVAGYAISTGNPTGRRGSSHSERMKLLGPIVMGIGLFIFICAGTLLFENRDYENRQRENAENLEYLNCKRKRKQEHRSRCRENCNGEDVEQGNRSKPSHTNTPFSEDWAPPLPPRTDRKATLLLPGEGERKGVVGEREEGDWGSTLLTKVLHHEDPPFALLCPSPSASSLYTDSCNSSEINFNVRTGSPLLSTD